MTTTAGYFRNLRWCMVLLLGGIAAGCGGDGDRDPILGSGDNVTSPPTVLAVAPSDTTINVSVSIAAVTATFREAMSPITGDATFAVTCAEPCVSPTGAVSLDSTAMIASFTPTAGTILEPLTLYTATVTAARSSTTGLALASPYSWSFTTGAIPDTTRPQVALTVPITIVPGPFAGMPINAAIVAAFNERMAPATIGETSFILTCEAPCTSPEGDVSYVAASRAAVFTPDSDLEPSTTYIATVTTAATDLAGNTLSGNQAVFPAASNYVWTFTTAAVADTTRPAVTVTAPVTTIPGPTPGASINTEIIAAFTKDMSPATITATSFTVTCTAPCVSPAGDVSYEVGGRSAVFTPSVPLASSSTYTATITTAATDLEGNALSGNQGIAPAPSDYIWTFTTSATPDLTRPGVTITAPLTTLPGPTPGVPTNTAISATFTEQMAPATMTSANFSVTCAGPCVSPPGTVHYAVGSKALVFTPASALAANTTYTVTVSTGAKDLAGNALGGNQALPPAASNYVWTFTTGATADAIAPTVLATNPINAAVGVCINKTINATFSEPMDPRSMTTSTFLLATTAGTPVLGLVFYDAQTNIATFNPVSNLTGAPPTNYTATIVSGANGVKDLAGNQLATDNVTTFTTNASSCIAAPPLGAAATFGSFGGNATVTNTGLNTIIRGDLGVNAPSTTVTGFRDSGGNVYTVTPNNDGLVEGLVYTLTAPPGSVAGAAASAARADALVAFNSISPAALPGGIDVSSLAQCPSCGGAGGGPDELAGRVLPPGVYLSTSGTYDIGGLNRTQASLTLDGGGDTSAVWVFQTAADTGTLNVGLTGPSTPATPIQVLLINGAQARNVFWYVPAGATIGTGSTMVGTMLSDASITMSTTGGVPPTAVLTTLNGRAIALTAAVTMTNTVVNVPAP